MYSSLLCGFIEIYIGYFSFIVMELNITKLHQRNMLCSGEWYEPHTNFHQPTVLTFLYSCGMPTFANATSMKCKQCEQAIRLRLNPRLVFGPSPDITSILTITGWSTCGRDRLHWLWEAHLVRRSMGTVVWAYSRRAGHRNLQDAEDARASNLVSALDAADGMAAGGG